MAKVTKEELFQQNLKNALNMSQILKYHMAMIATSETVGELAEIAKKNKVKTFVDLRKVAAKNINAQTAFLLDVKSANMAADTFRAIQSHLTSEVVQELSEILVAVCDIYDVQQLKDMKNMLVEYKHRLKQQQ